MNPEIQATLDKWADAYARKDWDALSGLYTQDALFFGGSGTMYSGAAGARTYFAAMPARTGPSMIFRDVATRQIAPDAVNVAMVGAAAAEGEPARDIRFTQTHVRTPNGWRIASHHGSVGT